MADVKSGPEDVTTKGASRDVLPPLINARDAPKRRIRILPILITLCAVALAIPLGWAMWNAYMAAPWTRDGTIRVYIVTMAPQVAGQIVELPVADKQFVHKGDLLMAIDPTNYKISVSLAEAAVQQAQITAQNAQIQAKRRQELTTLSTTVDIAELLGQFEQPNLRSDNLLVLGHRS